MNSSVSVLTWCVLWGVMQKLFVKKNSKMLQCKMCI